ncbi:hypothetical protein SAY86_027634 [Trapa natans]|uniref:Uncharacterized protein n=1 Tax=Trapa natans TaxID=22666 RepID=A0AAN7KR51_TRANT|nr:hypothetical protein SAY86_027634 [Trapa natans]
MGRKRRRKGPTEAADPINVFGRVLSPDTGRELSSVHFSDFQGGKGKLKVVRIELATDFCRSCLYITWINISIACFVGVVL